MKKRVRKILSGVTCIALIALCISACGTPAAPPSQSPTPEALPDIELTIFAAASMTETLQKIATLYKTAAPNVTLVFNFDSSGTLKTQIEQGAGCDMFISAAPRQIMLLYK